MRKLVIKSCSKNINCKVELDGKIVETLGIGKTITIPIDQNRHVLQCHQMVMRGDAFSEGLATAMNGGEKTNQPSNVVEILAGNTDYGFYLQSEKCGFLSMDTKIDLIESREVLPAQQLISSYSSNLTNTQIRRVTIVNDSGIRYSMAVVIDGYMVESVNSGTMVNVPIDSKKHMVRCYYEYGSGDRSSTNEMEIPSGRADYKYYIKTPERTGLSLFFQGGLKIELVEDDEQYYKRKRMIAQQEEMRVLEKQKQEREQELNDRVTNLLQQEWRKKGQEWDFQRALSVLSQNERESRVVKNILDFFIPEMVMKSIAKPYCSYERVYSMLGTIRSMPEYQQEVEDILKYEDILCNKQQRISSVFSDMENYADAYKKLEDKYLNKFQGYSINGSDIPRKYLMRIDEIKETYKNEQYQRNLELQMFANADIEELFELREILVFIAMNPTPNEDDNLAMQAVNLCYDYFVAPIIQNEKGVTYLPTVDRIIAKTIVLSRANLIDNVMEDLQKTLEVMGSKDIIYKDTYIVTTSQFEVLRKVFEYYKATREEIAVLEAMYKYNIPRTIEQEQRLAFLKKGTTNAPKMYENNTESEVFQYDYRVLQWSESDITNYIENFTMNSKKCTIPMAVANFEKSVMVRSFEWENEEILPILKTCMQENFGDKYHVQTVESATVTDRIEDGISAILISEKKSSVKGYPWLGFLVIGDQVTLKQMNLSIYALYLPNKISEMENIVQLNEKIISDVTVIKMKQNPRINNYISTVTNILLEVIEEWINNQMSSDIYG